MREEHEERVEADLVGFARRFDPDGLAQIARRITALLDPDGASAEVEYRHRRRYLDLHRRPDGSAHVEGDLDVEAAEHLQVVLDALAAPKPAQDGTPDPRTAGQRRHDALLDLCQLGMRARLLPTTGGVTTTVVLLIAARDPRVRHRTRRDRHRRASSPPAKPNAGPPATPGSTPP